jgi:hypothetical protein
MRSRVRVLLVLLAVAAGSGACATSEQWAEWHKHSSHFASGDHLFFSLRNRGANPTPRVYKSDVNKAQAQSWWGDAIVVRPEQLFEG